MLSYLDADAIFSKTSDKFPLILAARILRPYIIEVVNLGKISNIMSFQHSTKLKIGIMFDIIIIKKFCIRQTILHYVIVFLKVRGNFRERVWVTLFACFGLR